VATYLTDSWSTISGLAAVAYGSPDRYPEVANQVRRKSVTGFLGPTPPSDVIGNRLDRVSMGDALTAEYGRGQDFAKFIDGQGQPLSVWSDRIYSGVLQAYNEFATYESSITDALEYVAGGLGITLNTQRVKDDLVGLVSDLDLYSQLASSVTYNKLDKLPAGTRIQLDDSTGLDSDSGGVGFPTGYLTPADYFSGVAYPGMGTDGTNLPDNIVKSLTEGYQGYATLQPLDDLLRPGIATLMSLADISDIRGTNRAIAGLGTIGTLKDLSGIGSMSPADQVMYSVDLSEIVVGMNGYTVYDPATDSNGDFIDTALVPDYAADNADTGLPYSQRPRTSTFDQ
jgi:hypothetical protein